MENPNLKSQILHVCNIYLHLPQKLLKCIVGKYSSTMEHLGLDDDWWYPHDSGPVADIPTSRRPRRSLQRCFFWVDILTKQRYNL